MYKISKSIKSLRYILWLYIYLLTKNFHTLKLIGKECDIIHELKNNNNVIIKKAGKGSAIVIMDIEQCKIVILSILQYITHYVKLNNYQTSKTMLKTEHTHSQTSKWFNKEWIWIPN